MASPLPDYVDWSDPIQVALYIEEGSSAASWSNLVGQGDQSQRHELVCRDCHHHYIEMRLHPAKLRPWVYCLRCEAFTGRAFKAAPTVAGKSSRNDSVSRPNAPAGLRINNQRQRREMTAIALRWLHWGHGAKYKSDPAAHKMECAGLAAFIQLDLLLTDPEIIVDCRTALKAKGPQIVKSTLAVIQTTLQASQAGSKFSARELARLTGVSPSSMTLKQPLGRLIEATREYVAEWDDTINRAYCTAIQ